MARSPLIHPSRRHLVTAALAILLPLATAQGAAAQGGPGAMGGDPAPGEGSRMLAVGLRGGMDVSSDAGVLGAHLRIPIDPWRRLELMPSADATFLSGLTEYQLNADAALLLDSGGTLYVGGGAAFRNTIYESGEERRFEPGYNLLAGIRTRARRTGQIGTQIEARWSWVDRFDPMVLTLGVNLGVALPF